MRQATPKQRTRRSTAALRRRKKALLLMLALVRPEQVRHSQVGAGAGPAAHGAHSVIIRKLGVPPVEVRLCRTRPRVHPACSKLLDFVSRICGEQKVDAPDPAKLTCVMSFDRRRHRLVASCFMSCQGPQAKSLGRAHQWLVAKMMKQNLKKASHRMSIAMSSCRFPKYFIKSTRR